MRARLPALLALLFGCASPQHPKGSPAPRPSVVVAIVVDQLAAWEMLDRMPLLPQEGGFARLAREGTRLSDVRFEHSATDTAPGHAALFTGRWPSQTGIVQNEVIDDRGELVSVLKDSATRLIGYEGELNAVGASSRHLTADTVADRLRAKEPMARIVGLSLKDRGTLIPTGHACNVCLWFDAGKARFVTSSAIAETFPRWADLGSHDAIAQRMMSPWTPLDPTWLEKNALTSDAHVGEGDLAGLGTTFPHVAKNGKAFRGTPAGDDVLFELALRAIDHEHPRLLTLSLSSHDVISHTFGPDSRETLDQVLRLDRSLATFLGQLDARYPNGGYAVVLSADHGSSPMPEARDELNRKRPCGIKDAFVRPCVKGSRIFAAELTRELRDEVAGTLGEGEWVKGVADPLIVLTERARALPEAGRAQIDAAVNAIARKHTHDIEQIFRARELDEGCPTSRHPSELFTLVCHSYTTGAGDYVIVPKSGSFFDPYIVKGFGTSHGTPWLFDRSVPLFAKGPGVEGGRSVTAASSFRAYSRVIESWLGLSERSANSTLIDPSP